jgi:hypothetical protein
LDFKTSWIVFVLRKQHSVLRAFAALFLRICHRMGLRLPLTLAVCNRGYQAIDSQALKPHQRLIVAKIGLQLSLPAVVGRIAPQIAPYERLHLASVHQFFTIIIHRIIPPGIHNYVSLLSPFTPSASVGEQESEVNQGG